MFRAMLASGLRNEYCIVEKNGFKLGVINLLGQFAMNPIPDNPFNKAEELISRLKDEHVNGIVVDFHAEATAEKTAMGYLLDGRVSVVFGTHTHVQTADNRVLKGGTGYITDIGMSGCNDSVIGMEISRSLGRLKDKLPEEYATERSTTLLRIAPFALVIPVKSNIKP